MYYNLAYVWSSPVPIEVLHQTPDGKIEYDNELIEAGDGLLVADSLDGQHHIIAVDCDDDGQTGTVRVMPAELALIHSPSGPMVRADVFHAVKPVVIDEDTPYEMDVMDSGEVRGRFVARYASSLAITKSGLIPEGLIYPDRRVIFDDETPAIADDRQIENACELMLPAPDEFDQDWCDWFNELYAGKNVRIGIEATYVYWQSPPSALTANHEAAYCPWQNRGAPGMKRMESIDIADYEDNDEEGENPIPTLVDGEIISAKMLSFWEEDRWEHIPYAILSDVRRAETGELIEDDSATELLVPLDQDDGPVIIYKPE